MTHASPDSRPPRPSAEYRWTNRKAHAFLDALALDGKVAAAARAQAIGGARRRGELPQVAPAGFQGDTSPPQGDASGAAR